MPPGGFYSSTYIRQTMQANEYDPWSVYGMQIDCTRVKPPGSSMEGSLKSADMRSCRITRREGYFSTQIQDGMKMSY